MKKVKKCKKNICKNNNYNGRNVYGQPCVAKFVKLEKETALDQSLARGVQLLKKKHDSQSA